MNTSDFFIRKKLSPERALAFGLIRKGRQWTYHTTLIGGRMELQITVEFDSTVRAEVTDCKTKAPYVLHTVERASGKFVGSVKAEVEHILQTVAAQCFEPDVFKSKQASLLTEYVRNTYHGELEFLWKQFPDNAVWRRADNRKWYGALLVVAPQKLGLPAGGHLDILDVRMIPEQARLIDGKTYFAGYHMNKQHWLTVKLDGSLPFTELQHLIDTSYRLAG